LRIWDVDTGSCIEKFEEFQRPVNTVYLSDNNQLILSGESDLDTNTKLSNFLLNQGMKILFDKNDFNNLKLWDLKSTNCIVEFQGHSIVVYSGCIDENNQLVLSGGGDRVMKLWDTRTGECLQIFGELNKGFDTVFGHKSTVSSVAFTNDSVLSGSQDSTLKLWNKDTGECLRTFEGHTDRVTSISVTKNGKFAISSEESQKLKLWNLETAKCLRTFSAHSNSNRITSVSISECGDFAVSASFDKTLELWQINCLTSKQYSAPSRLSRFLETEFVLENEKIYQQKLKEAKAALEQKDYLTAKRHLEVAINIPGYSYREEVLKCWRSLYLHLPHRKLKDVLASSKFKFLEELPEIAIAHYKRTPKLLGELHTSVHLDRYSHCILVGRTRSTSFNLELLNFPHLDLNKSLEGFEKKWEEVTESAGKLRDEWLQNEEHTVFEKIKYTLEQGTEAFKMLSTLTRRNIGWGAKTCLYLSADNSLAVSGHELGRLKLYNVQTGKLIWTYRRHGIISHNPSQNIRPTISDCEVKSVCISQDNSLILSGGMDKTLKLWEIGNHESIRASLSGDCLRTFEGHQGGVLSVCLSLDNQFALSGSADKMLKLWEVSTGHCLKTIGGHQDSVNSVCIFSGAKFALSGSADKTIKLWNLETEKCVRNFQGHTEPVNSIFLSVDNKYFISGSDDKTARVWNIETGECLQIFEGHTNKITSVCLASNNQWAVSANGEHIKVWFLNWELEERQTADWSEGARLYLETFLKQHTPYTVTLPNNKKTTEEEITLSLTRQGIPLWTEKDFENLLYTLGCAGYGWLRSKGVRQQLESMRASIQKQEYLIAAKSIDYTQLRDLLAQEKWQEANEETWQLILKIINYEVSQKLSANNFENFSSEHLHIIDQLWIDYSQGYFGFSVQKNIISEIIGESETLQKKWKELGNCLGWRENDEWKEYNNLTFSLEANKGHLPILGGSSLPLFFWTQRFAMYSYLMLSDAWKSLNPIQCPDFDISQLLSETAQDRADTPQTESNSEKLTYNLE
jgi:WD40 repeat protein